MFWPLCNVRVVLQLSVVPMLSMYVFLLQASTGDADPLYVVEVLVHCSQESVKNAATEAAKPAATGEKGEMQVCI